MSNPAALLRLLTLWEQLDADIGSMLDSKPHEQTAAAAKLEVTRKTMRALVAGIYISADMHARAAAKIGEGR